ncbi:ABC transporter substrate-binding protein [Streptomyces sp. NBC_00859]|uniref:ABC transporter substrate-binding protein n=1 Tax=Streptomyces sp. NBC_00859 TaxID=2903682 RepID=UPI003863831E|nr:ABC transporter substrate-binding protein [Streptomyces sp. NBC_00859]
MPHLLRYLRRARLLCGSAALLLLAGCGHAQNFGSPPTLSASTPPARADTGAIRWALYAEPPVLDYVYAFDYPQNTILSNVCESLMRLTPSLHTEPALARKASHPDPLTWVYDLRSGVRFQHGGTMTAADAVYSLRRHMDKRTGSYWAEDFKNVRSIRRTGPLQVTVELRTPDALFPQAMANSAGTVASAATMRAEKNRFGTADGTLDCTGPYALARWSRGSSIKLTRFDGYWGRPAKNTSVTFSFLPDAAARTNALLTGEVDGTYAPAPESLERLKASDEGQVYFGEGLTTINLALTNPKGPLGDVRVRRALSLALDRDGFARVAMHNSATPSSSLVTDGTWTGLPKADSAARERTRPSTRRDLPKARHLIQEAHAQGKKITIATSPVGPDVSQLATAVQDAGTRIGLHVDLRTIAPDAFTSLFSDAQARKGIDLFPYTYYLSINDPLGFYTNMRTGEFENYGSFSSPAYDRTADEASVQDSLPERRRLAVKLEHLADRDLPVVPVAELPNSVFLNKRITGAPTTISYLYYPWAADIGAAQPRRTRP